MKKVALLCGLILALCSFTFSDPIPTACVSGTLSSYEGLGATGCTVGNLAFSNFTFGASAAGAGAILPVDTGISVTPVSSTNNAGFLFDVAIDPASNQSLNVTVDYVVRVLSGANITDSALSVEAHGNASADMTECLGGMLPACSGGTAVGLTADPANLAVSNTFAGQTMIDAGYGISASNGGAISGEQVQFSTGSDAPDGPGDPGPGDPGGGGTTAPEPASLMLFGTGILGVALLLRKRIRLPL